MALKEWNEKVGRAFTGLRVPRGFFIYTLCITIQHGKGQSWESFLSLMPKTTKNKTWSQAKNEQIIIYRKLGKIWSNQSERIREWDGLQIQCIKSEKIIEFDYKCVISLWQPCLRLGFSESDSVICNIKLGVIRTNKDISENPQRSSRHI